MGSGGSGREKELEQLHGSGLGMPSSGMDEVNSKLWSLDSTETNLQVSGVCPEEFS